MDKLIGSTLKEIRIEKKISQRKLAEMAGITNGHISKIEKNKSDVSVAILNRITNALGISICDLFLRVEDGS